MRFMALPALIFTVVPVLRNPLKSVGIYQIRCGCAEALRERRPLVANGVFQQRNAPQGIRRPSPGGLNHVISPPFQWDGLLVARAMGRTESERTPCAPWMSTPSISAVADGPVWKQA